MKGRRWQSALWCALMVLGLWRDASADGPCNGDALAGTKLRPLLTGAAAATMRAAADVFGMLAFLEEGRAKLGDARKIGSAAIEKLDSTIRILEKDAAELPDKEFEGITERVTKADLTQVAQRLRIPPGRIWVEVAQAVKAGGKGWLGECIRSKKILRDGSERFRGGTKGFVASLDSMPVPRMIWELMVLWQDELDRQRYLTMALTE